MLAPTTPAHAAGDLVTGRTGSRFAGLTFRVESAGQYNTRVMWLVDGDKPSGKARDFKTSSANVMFAAATA